MTDCPLARAVRSGEDDDFYLWWILEDVAELSARRPWLVEGDAK